jgi:hypothetical protein
MPQLLRELPGPNMGTVYTPRITSTALLLVGQAPRLSDRVDLAAIGDCDAGTDDELTQRQSREHLSVRRRYGCNGCLKAKTYENSEVRPVYRGVGCPIFQTRGIIGRIGLTAALRRYLLPYLISPPSYGHQAASVSAATAEQGQ